MLQDNVKVKNITATGENPYVKAYGGVQITGNVTFQNAPGKVIAIKTEKIPKLKPHAIKNGEIEGDYQAVYKGFDKVAGMRELKKILSMDVIEPITKPKLYKQMD